MKRTFLIVRGDKILRQYHNEDSAIQFVRDHRGYRIEEVEYDI